MFVNLCLGLLSFVCLSFDCSLIACWQGKSSPQTLLYDAVAVIQKLMAIDPTEVRFNIVALTAAFDD